ncbi:MAG: hypothetical protein OHK0031_15220 [Anaerolineales bacterium]
MAAKILIVDDDPSIRLAMRSVLQTAGYEIAEAEDGLAGLEKALSFAPDLVLLDVNMPKMDGLELCRRFKSDPALVAIFVVIVSGSRVDADSRVAGLETGADGYLVRPLTN